MTQDGEFNYGPRLTDDEYDRAIVSLHSRLPPTPSRQQRRNIRRQELELAIDHRLGVNFPRSRRNALWAVQQKIERSRLRLMSKYLLRRFFGKSLIKGAQGLASYLVEAYGSVLTRAELEQFFGEAEARNPTLPVDSEQMKK